MKSETTVSNLLPFTPEARLSKSQAVSSPSPSMPPDSFLPLHFPCLWPLLSPCWAVLLARICPSPCIQHGISGMQSDPAIPVFRIVNRSLNVEESPGYEAPSVDLCVAVPPPLQHGGCGSPTAPHPSLPLQTHTWSQSGPVLAYFLKCASLFYSAE